MSATLQGASPTVDHALSTVSRVYCGMSKPDGSSVSNEDLQSFIDDTVSHTFPDGFTVLFARGGWRDLGTGQTIQEPSAVIELAHGSQDASRVLDVARAYKTRFGQQAVMVSSTPVATRFV